MCQHTPGPLETTYESATNTWGICLPEGGDVLAQLIEKESDATMFAAAPAMYEALKLCKAFIDHGPSATRSAARCKEVYDNALAQAEGKG